MFDISWSIRLIFGWRIISPLYPAIIFQNALLSLVYIDHTIRKVNFLSKKSILTKPQHFHEFFTQKIDNFHGKSKLNIWTKNEDFEQCEDDFQSWFSFSCGRGNYQGKEAWWHLCEICFCLIVFSCLVGAWTLRSSSSVKLKRRASDGRTDRSSSRRRQHKWEWIALQQQQNSFTNESLFQSI